LKDQDYLNDLEKKKNQEEGHFGSIEHFNFHAHKPKPKVEEKIEVEV
jgi:hypothetical protein